MGKPCCGEDWKIGERRLLFLGPRTDRNPGSIFTFAKAQVTLEVGLCYQEKEVGQSLAGVLVMQGSAKWVKPEEPKQAPKPEEPKQEAPKEIEAEKPKVKRRIFGKVEGSTTKVVEDSAPKGGE